MNNKLKLSKEDKIIFKNQVKTLNPIEFIQVTKELEFFKDRFTNSDWKFICSCLGKRGHKFLKNVVRYNSFEINNNADELFE